MCMKRYFSRFVNRLFFLIVCTSVILCIISDCLTSRYSVLSRFDEHFNGSNHPRSSRGYLINILGRQKSSLLDGIQTILEKQYLRSKGTAESCHSPRLDVNDEAVSYYFKKLPPLHCSGNEPVFYINKTDICSNPLYERIFRMNISRCTYLEVAREYDFTYYIQERINGGAEREKFPFAAPLQHDFTYVACYLKKKKLKKTHTSTNLYRQYELVNGHITNNNDEFNSKDLRGSEYSKFDFFDSEAEFEQTYAPIFEDVIASVVPKKEVIDRAHRAKNNDAVNVLILCLDSISRLAFERLLPKSYAYLKNVLKSVVLDRYNIVGDGTTANIIPLLTGFAIEDLPEARRTVDSAWYVDNYPFIWKAFRKNGYATMYSEDEPTLGTFNLRLRGFAEQPTDHYMRHFWQMVWDDKFDFVQNSKHFCVGALAKHQIHLNYLHSFFRNYPKSVPKFAYSQHSELSHSNNNPIQFMDDDLVNTLRSLKDSGDLENTLLVVMGDHGLRYSQFRKTMQGKLEERLPMMSITLPETFKLKFPKAAENLYKNHQVLASPYDLHHTLMDIANTTRLLSKKTVQAKHRGQSLFRQMNRNRSCVDAGIETHWCTCLSWHSFDTKHELAKLAGKNLVSTINYQVANYTSLCSSVRLGNIQSVHLVVPDVKLLKYVNSFDDDHRVANFSRKLQTDVLNIQIVVETVPGNALFEATLKFHVHQEYFTPIGEISRLNKYGNQSDCVVKEKLDLRKYCYCNVTTGSKNDTL